MATNYTLQDVLEIEAALATGAKTVRHGETSIEFRSDAEMREQLRIMKAELGLIPAIGTTRIRRLRFVPHKGL